MDYIKLTRENLESEHICCAISNNKDIQVSSKKKWLADRLDEGLVFLKSVERGKCFIEYIPAEYAWFPVKADNCMHINCLWVSGSFKGHGYSNDLLDYAVRDAKSREKNGITVISSVKKRPFISDPKYLDYKGFRVVDTAAPNYTLMYLPFDDKKEVPRFKECARTARINDDGFVLYYTFGCPYTAKYVPLVEAFARENNLKFKSILIDNREAAQNSPTVWTDYALFYNGEYVTNEILNEKRFNVLVKELIQR